MENYKPNTVFAIEKKLFSYVVCADWLKKKTTQFMATVNVWMVTL